MVKCANPLFLRWVREFHRAKDYRVRGGPPRATGYENAIRGLEACTEKFEHPADMRQTTVTQSPMEKVMVHGQSRS